MTKRAKIKKEVVAPPARAYRIIALSFLGAAVLLFLVVAYFTFARAEIILHPKREILTANFSMRFAPEPAENVATGRVFKEVFEKFGEFELAGPGTELVSQARGTAVIINNSSRDQPLVRTTRLLTPDGKLFRIDRSVTAPAGGSVEVPIYADAPGREGEIAPSRFTIPGLWEGLQSQIYAESSEPTCCGVKVVRVVRAEDQEAARSALLDAIMADAKEKLRAEAAGFDGEIFEVKIMREIFEQEIGEASEKLNGEIRTEVTAVFYSRESVIAEAEEVLRALAGTERELVALDPARASAEIDALDFEEGTAVLRIDAPGVLVLRPLSDLFDLSKVAGLDPGSAVAYFERFRSVESVEIEFSMPWQKRLPAESGRISVKIAK